MLAAGAERSGGRPGIDFACIEDRRAAIDELLNRARSGDVVVLAGKGHEQSQIYCDRLCPWNDAAVARDALAALRAG
jgi:UDP-N-acetylmuramoyl-L-alanyl-D-glutamate--2,6-diaminopimelate ligase